MLNKCIRTFVLMAKYPTEGVSGQTLSSSVMTGQDMWGPIIFTQFIILNLHLIFCSFSQCMQPANRSKLHKLLSIKCPFV